jgi:hypothetical protein
MRKATRIVAASFGFIAGIAGLEHGYFEVLQGNARPVSLMFASMGSPCVPERIWHACEPAMTLLPNFLITGILTVIISLLTMIWSTIYIQRKGGGSILILLSIILLLFGGGFFPPLFGIVGGVAETQIDKSLVGKSIGSILRFAAKLWPWPLVIFIVWVLGQYLVGYFFNDFLRSIMGLSLLLMVVLLPLSVYAGYAYDAQNEVDAPAIGK